MSNTILLAQTPEPEFSAEHKTQNTIKHLQTSFTWWILAKLARRLTQGVPRGVPRGVTRLSPKNRCCWLNRLPAPGRSSEPNAGVKCQRLFLQIPNRGQGGTYFGDLRDRASRWLVGPCRGLRYAMPRPASGRMAIAFAARGPSSR